MKKWNCLPCAGGVGAAARLGDAERLQPQLTGGDFRQIHLFLLGATVAQDRTHRIHLRVAGAAVATGLMDLFHDRRCLLHA